MTRTFSFDRVADIYDETRGLPPDVLARIADAIIAETGSTSDTSYLELGVGTGRIALPLIERGVRYTGVDISENMMQRMREKLATQGLKADLRQADVTDLPFEDGSFDVVLGVHVFHIVEDWPRALHEARRVLHSGGHIVLGSDEGVPGEPGSRMYEQWRTIQLELGVATRKTATTNLLDEVAMLKGMGARVRELEAVRWNWEVTPRDMIDRVRRRTHSQTWVVPDDVLNAAADQLEATFKAEYGGLDQRIPSAAHFVLYVATFG